MDSDHLPHQPPPMRQSAPAAPDNRPRAECPKETSTHAQGDIPADFRQTDTINSDDPCVRVQQFDHVTAIVDDVGDGTWPGQVLLS